MLPYISEAIHANELVEVINLRGCTVGACGRVEAIDTDSKYDFIEGGGAAVDEVEVGSELVSERISGRISDISIKILSRGNLC